MAIASPGIGSNIDVNGIVTKLVALERQPIQRLDLREASFQAKLSAIGSLKASLSSLQSAAAGLNASGRFRALSASVSDSDVMSVSAAAGAVPGTYDVEVLALAQSQKLASGAFSSADALVGTGTLTIQFGTSVSASDGPPATPASFTANNERGIASITIDSSNNTLAGVRDAINSANIGVRASIINDGTGFRLALSSKDTGAANSLKITVDEGTALPADNTDTVGLSQLAFDPVAAVGSGQNLTQTVAARDASVLINGLTVTSASNTISTAIDKVTLNLTKAKVGSPATLTIAPDAAGIKSAVDGFVKAYNDAIKNLRELTAFNADTKQAGVLQGDSSILSLQSQIRNVLNSPVNSTSGYQSLSDVGIAIQRDGTLSVDSTKLQAAINNPDKDLAALFAATGSVSDATFKFTSSSTSTRAGRYEVVISQAATQGKAEGSSAVGALTIDSTNDALQLSVNGTAVSITLTHRTYASAAELATELQQRINGASAVTNAGLSVSVTEATGTLTVTSNNFGADSKVAISGGNALSNLFGSVTSTDGFDVAGTIGGNPATGSGQSLIANSGDAAGLQVTVEGTTTGSLGWAEFTEGFGARLNGVLTQMLSGTGALSTRVDGINATIKGISSQRDAIERQAQNAEKRFLAQYNALDATISRMLGTSQFLQQQLSALPSLQSS